MRGAGLPPDGRKVGVPRRLQARGGRGPERRMGRGAQRPGRPGLQGVWGEGRRRKEGGAWGRRRGLGRRRGWGGGGAGASPRLRGGSGSSSRKRRRRPPGPGEAAMSGAEPVGGTCGGGAWAAPAHYLPDPPSRRELPSRRPEPLRPRSRRGPPSPGPGASPQQRPEPPHRGWRLTQPRCAPVPAPVLGRLTQSVLRTWEAAGSAGERFRFGGVRRGPGSRLRERELRAGPRARTRSPWRPDSEAKASAHVSARGGDPRGPFLLSRAEGRFGDHIEGRGGPPRLRTVWSGVPGRRQRRLASSWRGTFRGPRGPKAWASGRGARVPLGQPCGNPGRAGFRPGRAACPGP